MEDCLFCKLAAGDIPSNKVFENEHVIGFEDIYPQAKTHLLFINKSHSNDFLDSMSKNNDEVVQILNAINEFANSNELASNGFRIVTNNGKSAGQTVFHTHFHVLSDTKLGRFGS